MKHNGSELIKETSLKSSATMHGEKLERGPHSLVALLQSTYITTGQVIHRIRVNDRSIPVHVQPRFLKSLPWAKCRGSRRNSHS